MPRVDFERLDLAVCARAAKKDRIELEFRTGRGEWRTIATRDDLARGSLRVPKVAVQKWNRLAFTPNLRSLKRITVETDKDLAGLPWERALPQPSNIVRVTRVIPYAGPEPFKLPMRIVQIGESPALSVSEVVGSLFGKVSSSLVREAVQVSLLPTLDAFEDQSVTEPTTDVIHMEKSALAGVADPLSTANPQAPGTLAWLARRTCFQRTRLVVLACATDNAETMLRLGWELISRGGPAVLVESLPETQRPPFYRAFYSNLIHDFPLDSMLENAVGSLPSESRAHVRLFAGAGREDELRVSSVGLRALAIPKSSRFLAHATQVRKELNLLQRNWETVTFEFHEREGLLPLAQSISKMRTVLRKMPPPIRMSPAQAPPSLIVEHLHRTVLGGGGGPGRLGSPRIAFALQPPPPPPLRYVNIGFCQDAGAIGLRHTGPPSKHKPAPLTEIRQKGARLNPGEVVQLGIDIGPRKLRIRVADAAPVDEELFRWEHEMQGTWVEVAVTGIDFEVIGDPIRELWLPRERPSERVFFPVAPRSRNGAARLRVCLYHNHDVVQSFRVVALLEKTSAAAGRKKLAAALAIDPRRVGDSGFMARLEYSTASVAAVATRSENASRQRLSVVANDWDDDTVITVKGPGLYSAKILVDADLPKKVQKIRDTLRAISVRKFEDGTEGYAFGLPGRPNAATVDKLSESLTSLAVLGWRLFDKLLLGDDQEKFHALIDSGAELTIHVAHLLREKVMPWGVLYDRFYDKDKQKDDQGKPVAFGFCPAARPDENGELTVRTCFGHGCLLEGYPAKRVTDEHGKTLLPETVVCPLHFWGFRHVIEVPPQQTPSGKERSPMWEQISVDGKARLAAGINCTLSLYQDHMKELAGAATKVRAEWHDPAEYDRQKIITMLMDPDLSGIYFYCHADSDGGDGEPVLIFQGPKESDAKGVITPDALRGSCWSRHPLVFLNGCSTAAYSPEAMSPFFKKLVDDRQAAGIIGTEIAVKEQLAREIARCFFKAFLDLVPAGSALLKARRAILAQNNPLGLVYTLYASADLKMAPKAD